MGTNQKAKLALELLEREMEILSKEAQYLILGGEIGQKAGGTGTAIDPYVINTSIYFGYDMQMSTISGLLSAAGNINTISSNGINVDGKFYKFNVSLIETSTTSAAISSAQSAGIFAGLIREDTLGSNSSGLILGNALSQTARIDVGNMAVASANSGYVISHEIGHLFGLDHVASPTGTAMGENYTPSYLTTQDLKNIIIERGW